MSERSIVWLDETSLTGNYVYSVHDAQAPDGYAYEVMASSEQVVRWQGAQKAWETAQAEMRTLFAEAVDIADTVEAVEDHLKDEESAKAQQEWEAEARMIEAKAEEEHGPRQWVLVDLQRTSGGWRQNRLTTYAHRVHHKDCPAYLRVLGSTPTSASGLLGHYERTPEALAWLRKVAGYKEPKTTACKRCASSLITALED